MTKNNVFRGENGALDFLNPHNHQTPLVEVPKKLNPYYDDGVHIFVKMLNFNPLMNVKSLPAYNMLSNASDEDLSKTNLVEDSSGNTAFSLAILANYFGFKKSRIMVAAKDVSRGKLQALLLAGAQVQAHDEPICPDPTDENSGIYLAKQMGKTKTWFNPNQYANEENPKAHYKITAPQIYNQMEKDIQIFSTGLGTSGTMVGCAKFLKEKIKSLKVVGSVRQPNNPVSGHRTLGLLKMIDFKWKENIDEVFAINTTDSYIKSLELCRAGLLLGPSSGFNFAGTLKYIKKLKRQKKLDTIRNDKGEINAVFIGCDSPFAYLDTYFQYLPKKMFHNVLNEELLSEDCKIEFNYRKEDKRINKSPKDIIKEYYIDRPSNIAKKIKNGTKVPVDAIIVDTRHRMKFENAKLPSSINITEAELFFKIDKYIELWSDKKVLFYCDYGELSYQIAQHYLTKGVESYSMKEGFMKWSELNLPRVCSACKI